MDLGVYTRNRCFRLYKSSKFGKREELLPAWLTPVELAFLSHDAETSLFFDTLVTNVPADSTMLTYGEDGCSGVLSVASTAPIVTRPTLLREATVAEGSDRRSVPQPPAVAPSIQPCPMPALEAFMLRAWAQKTGLSACTRAWSLDEARGTLSLSLGPSNRWCSHIGRQHRSNGVLLVATMRPSSCEPPYFFQQCFDADCRSAGFRGGDHFPLPDHVLARELGQTHKHSEAVADVDTQQPRSVGTRATPKALPVPHNEVGSEMALSFVEPNAETACATVSTPHTDGETTRTTSDAIDQPALLKQPWKKRGQPEAIVVMGSENASCPNPYALDAFEADDEWWDEEAERKVDDATRQYLNSSSRR